jgi:hypothetical protein
LPILEAISGSFFDVLRSTNILQAAMNITVGAVYDRALSLMRSLCVWIGFRLSNVSGLLCDVNCSCFNDETTKWLNSLLLLNDREAVLETIDAIIRNIRASRTTPSAALRWLPGFL